MTLEELKQMLEAAEVRDNARLRTAENCPIL
jgi:hypothetical protein